jgi:NTP pyrophosphatase (non-canonical NTP hydrolase)
MDQHKMYNLLHRAQETYGYPNQVLVATEELCELISAIRADIRGHVIEEIADVCICMHHLYIMFDINTKNTQWLKWFETAKNKNLDIIKVLADFATLLTKYPRYPDHNIAKKDIGQTVAMYTAMVAVQIKKLQEGYYIQDVAIEDVMSVKLNRLQRWLDSDNKTMYQTTIDREVK